MLLTPNQPEEGRWGYFLFSCGVYALAGVCTWAYWSHRPVAPNLVHQSTGVPLTIHPIVPVSFGEGVTPGPPTQPQPVAIPRQAEASKARLQQADVYPISLPGPPAPQGWSKGRSFIEEPLPVVSFSMSQSSMPATFQTLSATGSTVVKLEDIEPPVITYEPPVNKQIHGAHGEVVLQVRFRADGSVEILRVLQGLSAAQDAEARRIAQGMRFEPSHTPSGRVVDYELHLHITFG